MSRNSDIETVRRPQNEDMSMDDILASIRRIISDEEASEETFNQNFKNKERQVKTEDPAKQRKLSASDQLRALSSALYADNEERHYQQDHTERYQNERPILSVPERSFADILKNSEKNSASVTPRVTPPVFAETKSRNSLDNNREMSVNAAMDRIRSALAEEAERKKQHHYKKPFEVHTPENETIIPAADHAKLNFKSEEIGDIPGFLKKFSRMQKAEQEQTDTDSIFPTSDRKGMLTDEDFDQFETRKKVKYDFNSAIGFGEEDGILCLTEAVTPEKAEKTARPGLLQSPDQGHAAQERPETNSNQSSSRSLLAPITGEEGGDALELLIMRCLRPMLTQWIEENLQSTVEKVVRSELYNRSVK